LCIFLGRLNERLDWIGRAFLFNRLARGRRNVS
jgi:hypothetical protein